MFKAAAAALILLATACGARPEPSGGGGPIVRSEESPRLTLQVSPDFESLDPLRFPIENLTDAERRIFVDAGPDRRLRRMVVVQFEKVQPDSDFRFVFPSTPPRRFGAQTYRSGAFAYDDERAAAADPDREAGRTRHYLSTKGFASPRVWKVARLARVSDAEGLSEVIIFYMENGDADFPTRPLSGAGEDGDVTLEGAAKERLFRALESAVQVVEG